MADGLTGRVRFRDGWRGRLVLQVEQERPVLGTDATRKVWRDAELGDVEVYRNFRLAAAPEIFGRDPPLDDNRAEKRRAA